MINFPLFRGSTGHLQKCYADEGGCRDLTKMSIQWWWHSKAGPHVGTQYTGEVIKSCIETPLNEIDPTSNELPSTKAHELVLAGYMLSISALYSADSRFDSQLRDCRSWQICCFVVFIFIRLSHSKNYFHTDDGNGRYLGKVGRTNCVISRKRTILTHGTTPRDVKHSTQFVS